MTKIDQLILIISELESESAKRLLNIQLDAGRLGDMKNFVFGAKLYCPKDSKDEQTLAKLLTMLR